MYKTKLTSCVTEYKTDSEQDMSSIKFNSDIL